ncbi:hypothetical protein [Enterococcus durans]|jgi:hypothetical protein|uniref:hypothetical protein n=1 Tax=Enterococcus durans TaxID=53345 RepID=UPI00356151BA|nr:hypothetical protein [Neobacillus sp.]
MKKNRLIIKNIYLFSTSEKRAKRILLQDGINVITSNQKNGNKVGKSLILKSIFHTLGANSFFDSTLKKDSIVFVIQFSVNEIEYTMLRSGKFFKFFDSNYSLIISTESSTELAKTLYEIYSFSVLLPSRQEGKLALAPPAYAYLLNFIDQDKMNGSSFDSFDNLGHFANYKENLLYCHFGLFNEKYFDLTIKKDKLNEQLKMKNNDLKIISEMLNKINKEIPKAVPEDVETLRIELNKQEKQYREVYSDLKKTKDKLTRLRNEQAEISESLKEIQTKKGLEQRELKKVISDHTCPLCEQNLEDSLEVRLVKNINIEDLLQVSLELQRLLGKNKKDISKSEETYYGFLQKLNDYKKILRGSRKNQEEIIQIQGYSDLKTKLEKEWSEEHLLVKKIEDSLSAITKQLNVFKKKKNEVNSSYFKSMKSDKMKFGLEEITDDSIQKITSVVRGSGSNNPVITIIWYFNLLKIKNEFNPEAIKFPIILDSPNHGELDDTKKEKLFKYLFNNISEDSQCIISTLGFDSKQYSEIENLNVINLTNEPYHLLNDTDYKENEAFLEMLIDK